MTWLEIQDAARSWNPVLVHKRSLLAPGSPNVPIMAPLGTKPEYMGHYDTYFAGPGRCNPSSSDCRLLPTLLLLDGQGTKASVPRRTVAQVCSYLVYCVGGLKKYQYHGSMFLLGL